MGACDDQQGEPAPVESSRQEVPSALEELRLKLKREKAKQRVDSYERLVRRLDAKIKTESEKIKNAAQSGTTSNKASWLKTLTTRRASAEKKLKAARREYEKLLKAKDVAPNPKARGKKPRKKQPTGEYLAREIDALYLKLDECNRKLAGLQDQHQREQLKAERKKVEKQLEALLKRLNRSQGGVGSHLQKKHGRVRLRTGRRPRW